MRGRTEAQRSSAPRSRHRARGPPAGAANRGGAGKAFPPPAPGPEPLAGHHGCRERPRGSSRKGKQVGAGRTRHSSPGYGLQGVQPRIEPNRTGPDRAGPPGFPGPSASRRAAPQRSPKRIDRGTEEEQTKPPAVPYPPAGAAAGSHSSPSPLPRCRCSPPPPSYTTVAARGTLASLAEAEPPAPPGPSRLRDRALTGNGVLRPRHGSPSAPRPHRGIGLVPRAQRAPAGRSRSPLRRRSQPVPGPGALRSCRGRLHINIPKG